MIFANKGELPQHLPLIEIDYNVIDNDGLTYFRNTEVQSDIPLIIGQYVICFQPEDNTFVPGTIQQLGPQYSKVRVHWERMEEYVKRTDLI